MEPRAKPRILVIDDERALVEIIQEALTEEGMEVLGAFSADEGLRLFHKTQPDLVVLDIVLPGYDGWEVCRRLRRVSDVPVLMLTAMSDRTDLVRGLNLGADDYVTKPFSLAVLRARIDALLRRATRARRNAGSHIVQAGDVTVDMLSREVSVRNSQVRLSPKQFDLLVYLVRNTGRTVPRRELLQQVWGPERAAQNRNLNLYIWYLRTRIEENPSRPRRILTRRGLGYRFVPAS
ncbi:MAG: response regulator transcription factor [Anaerolineae bacterium]|nr:response regulator transcription factor [Anaerolineae bacterium]